MKRHFGVSSSILILLLIEYTISACVFGDFELQFAKDRIRF